MTCWQLASIIEFVFPTQQFPSHVALWKVLLPAFAWHSFMSSLQRDGINVMMVFHLWRDWCSVHADYLYFLASGVCMCGCICTCVINTFSVCIYRWTYAFVLVQSKCWYLFLFSVASLFSALFLKSNLWRIYYLLQKLFALLLFQWLRPISILEQQGIKMLKIKEVS